MQRAMVLRMNGLEDRRTYYMTVTFIWCIILVGAPLCAVLAFGYDMWWSAIPLVALVFGSPEIWRHFTGFERHREAVRQSQRRNGGV